MDPSWSSEDGEGLQVSARPVRRFDTFDERTPTTREHNELLFTVTENYSTRVRIYSVIFGLRLLTFGDTNVRGFE